MARDINRVAEILKRLMEISSAQRAHLEENRLDELLKGQSEREELFTELEGMQEFMKDERLKEAVNELAASDNVLFMNIESAVCFLKNKLHGVKKGAKAVKAYSGSVRA